MARRNPSWTSRPAHAANLFLDMAQTLEAFEFTQTIGGAEVTLQPLGVVAAISPWNSNFGSICGKLATAIAAGCTIVIKPSEMSAIQTQVLAEALHEAGAAGRRVQHRQRPRRCGGRRTQHLIRTSPR